jgi:uncharacterized membrane protein YhiD involved in acid resistance
MNATNHRAIAACLLHTTAVGAAAAAGHSTIACMTLAAAMAIPGLAALAREWFWYRALRRPARNLDRIHQLTNGKKGETERLMRMIQEGENNVLTARAAASGHAGRRQAP